MSSDEQHNDPSASRTCLLVNMLRMPVCQTCPKQALNATTTFSDATAGNHSRWSSNRRNRHGYCLCVCLSSRLSVYLSACPSEKTSASIPTRHRVHSRLCVSAHILSKNVTDEHESSQAASRLHEHLPCTSVCVSSMRDYQPPPALPHKARDGPS